MKSYRDYLDEKKVPRGPWATNHKGKPFEPKKESQPHVPD
jgi:hypothetical protein